MHYQGPGNPKSSESTSEGSAVIQHMLFVHLRQLYKIVHKSTKKMVSHAEHNPCIIIHCKISRMKKIQKIDVKNIRVGWIEIKTHVWSRCVSGIAQLDITRHLLYGLVQAPCRADLSGLRLGLDSKDKKQLIIIQDIKSALCLEQEILQVLKDARKRATCREVISRQNNL